MARGGCGVIHDVRVRAYPFWLVCRGGQGDEGRERVGEMN